jgi:hypothetical protein
VIIFRIKTEWTRDLKEEVNSFRIMNTLHLEIAIGVFTPIKSMSKRIFKALDRNPIESPTIYRWCAVNRETIDAFCSRAVKESVMQGQGVVIALCIIS